MNLGIMGAMPEAVAGIVDQIKDVVSHQIGGSEYFSGRWNGADIVVVFSRWGKVAVSAAWVRSRPARWTPMASATS